MKELVSKPAFVTRCQIFRRKPQSAIPAFARTGFGVARGYF